MFWKGEGKHDEGGEEEEEDKEDEQDDDAEQSDGTAEEGGDNASESNNVGTGNLGNGAYDDTTDGAGASAGVGATTFVAAAAEN
ncbi:hypothetical protein BGZ76_004454, partial [Entomortierella beljakovae]